MRVLLVLSAFLAASHAAPQFVFVLPQGFQQLGQEGAAPEIKPLNFDFSAATTAAEVAPAQEAEVAADADAAAAAELDAEAAGVVDPAADAEAAEVALEIPAEEVSPVVDATPAEETAPAEEIAAEGAPVTEVAIVEEVIPSENEIVVELVEPVVAKEEPVEEQPPVAATGKSLVAAEEVPVPTKVSPAPAVNQVDPLAIVDPRYRPFIYQNDAPDVVAAKIELFRIHADRIPVSAAAVTA